MEQSYKLYILHGMSVDTNTLHGETFMSMLSLRIAGYEKIYNDKAMPIDIYDFFSIQMLLCNGSKKSEPLACVRFVSLKDCENRSVPFLPLARVSGDTSNPQLIECVKQFMQNNKKQNIIYNSSLTITPSISSIRERQKIVKTIIGAALNYHESIGSRNFMASAPVKVRTDKLFQRVGFKTFCENPYYLLKTLNNEKTAILRHVDNTKTYKEWLAETKSLWEHRRELGAKPVINQEPTLSY